MAYGSFVIQHDLNFSIPPGAIFIIMGGSGCGKYAAAPSHRGPRPPKARCGMMASFWAAPRRTASA